MQISRVLVLGATGRIGGILRKCWPKGRALWQTRKILPDMGSDWIVCDVLGDAPGLARAAADADVILCLSGVIHSRQEGDLSQNITLAEAAIRAAHRGRNGGRNGGGARVMLASSAAVYGDQVGVLEETAPLRPINDYGRAKAEMETRGAALGAELGVAVTSLRIGNIAGLDAILGGWREGFVLDRFGDGATPRRSYIGLITLARVLGDLVAADDLPAVLNVAAPGTVEMGALLDRAGLPWAPRLPGDTVIPEVCLSTRELERFTALNARDAMPETLVEEWRAMTEATETTETTE